MAHITAEHLKTLPTSIIDDLVTELVRQKQLRNDGKFSNTAEDLMASEKVFKGFRMYPVLVEEVGEVGRCLNEKMDYTELRKELIQVAAVAVSAVIGLDRYLENIGVVK